MLRRHVRLAALARRQHAGPLQDAARPGRPLLVQDVAPGQVVGRSLALLPDPDAAGILMAVGMLNSALYCMLRVHLISSAALGREFSSNLLLALGRLSVLVATPFILIQWNLKRLLAYSSIEHVGKQVASSWTWRTFRVPRGVGY